MNTNAMDATPAQYLDTGTVEEKVQAEMPAAELGWQCDIGNDPDLWLYRDRTIAMLKTYLRYSIEVGRLPSVLGRELFRARLTSYRVATFEDAVIFVHDVESAIDRLNQFHQQLIGLIVLQDCTQAEAADMLRCTRRTVVREFPEALDFLSQIFLDGKLLTRLPTPLWKKLVKRGKAPIFC